MVQNAREGLSCLLGPLAVSGPHSALMGIRQPHAFQLVTGLHQKAQLGEGLHLRHTCPCPSALLYDPMLWPYRHTSHSVPSGLSPKRNAPGLSKASSQAPDSTPMPTRAHRVNFPEPCPLCRQPAQ